MTLRSFDITTMAELLAAATPENVDSLARDVGDWLRWCVVFRGVPDIAAEPVFRWTDDGKPGVNKLTVEFRGGSS